MATRRTQPYRKGAARMPGAALTAMQAGKPFFSPNPMDPRRLAAKRRKKNRKVMV